MTPAADERLLAGKWIVWQRTEQAPVVDMAGKVIEYREQTRWRYDRVDSKSRAGWLWTYGFIRLHVRDAFVVDEIADWPRYEKPDGTPGAYKAITEAEFDALGVTK